MTKNTSSNDTPTPTGSVPPVTGPFRFDLDVPVQDTVTKCSTCKAPTEHHWFAVGVMDITGATDQLELVNLYKRLTLCTQCGTLRLIK